MWTPSLCFWLIGVLFLQLGTPSGANLRDFLQCRLCETVNPEGNISDCSCDFASVNLAVEHFFQPLLRNITRSTFFRYFRVDLERHCPFWQEEGSCIMEGCSVCECDEKEVPRNWIDEQGSAIPRSTLEHMTPESMNHTQSTVTEADKLSSKSNSIDHEKDLPWAPASAPDEPTHTHLSGSSILDGDNRLRQQPWRQGQLLQPEQSEDPQMSGLHIANARNEDAAPDSDYDSYFALRAGKTMVSEANITGDDIVCDTNAVDASGKVLLKSAHSSACAYDPEIHSWTDMVEDDCLSGTHTGDNPATYATAEMVRVDLRQLNHTFYSWQLDLLLSSVPQYRFLTNACFKILILTLHFLHMPVSMQRPIQWRIRAQCAPKTVLVDYQARTPSLHVELL